MKRYVSRPKAPKKKIHSKDEFELCYLRHKYLRRVRYNPTEKDMKPFMAIATHFAKVTFFRYKNLFYTVGLELDDLINIARIHLTSFLGLFSLEKNKLKYKEFVKIFSDMKDRKPRDNDVLNKNKANFTLFLKQRMEDVVRVCRQKSRNIKGLPSDEYAYFCGPKPPPKIPRTLIKNYERLGFRKLDVAVFKTIKKRAGLIHTSLFNFKGIYYIAVPIEKKTLDVEDFSGADMDPHDSIHNMSPETIYFNLEDIEIWEKRKEEFDSKPDNVKANLVRNFIHEHKGDGRYKEEVRTAKRLLKELE